MRKASFWETEIRELEARLTKCEEEKQGLINYLQTLKDEWINREISLFDYQKTINEQKNGKTIPQLIEYYEQYADECRKEIKKLNKKRQIRAAKKVSFVTGFFLIIIFTLFFIIHFRVPPFLEPPTLETYSDNVNLNFSENATYQWQLKNRGKLASVKISGLIEGEEDVRVYLNNLIIFSSENLNKAGVQLSPNESFENNNLNETNITSGEIGKNLSFEIQPGSLQEDRQTSKIPIPAERVSVFIDHCENTCDLSKLDFVNDAYTVRIEINGRAKVQLDSITYEVLVEKIEKIPEEITQQEIKTKAGKKVTFSGQVSLKDVRVSINIPDSWKIKSESFLMAYLENENRFVTFDAFDTNNDDVLDKIDLTIPDLDSPQTIEIIVITKAEHLDENRTFISNIYEEVRELDDVWSETIPNQDYVKATFERNLTSEKDITIYPRVVGGDPRIEVYESNGSELIAEFQEIRPNEYNSIFLTNLQGTQDSFDLRVINGAIEIDHIVDPSFATTTLGLIVYGETTVTTPRYRLWNSSDFVAEQSAPDLGAGSTVQWVRVKSSTKRNQSVVGILDDDGDILFNVFNHSSGSWNNWIDVASLGIIPARDRGFDVEVEENTGDFIAVYERDNVNNRDIYYRRWNGTTWGPEGTITLNSNVAAQPQRFIVMKRKSNSNEIMMAAAGVDDDISAARWNDKSWVNVTTITLSAANTNQERFALSWESISGNAIIAFGNGTTNADYILWNNATQAWGNVQTIRNRAAVVEKITLCSDPLSDYIGVIIGPDSSSDILAVIWNGTGWLSNEPTEETDAERVSTQNAWCSWTKNTSVALFGYIDNLAWGVRFFTYNQTGNSWNCPKNSQTVGSLNNVEGSNGPCNTSNVMSDDLEVLRFFSDPNSNDIMILGMDLAEDLEMFIFNGTDLTQPTAALLEQTTTTISTTSPADFDYVRFIPPDTTAPTITINKPEFEGINYSVSFVDFNVTLNEEGNSCLYSLDGGVTNRTMQNNGNRDFNATNSSIADGFYIVAFFCNDLANNSASASRAFGVDATAPLILYGIGTENNGANLSQNFVYVNVTWTEVNFNNITFLLRNESSIVNSTTFTIPINEINWTNLIFGNYTYNVSIFDTAGNFNSTETRLINLSAAPPNNPPHITFVSVRSNVDPLEGTFTLVHLNFTIEDSDGIEDIDGSTIVVNFSRIGEPLRENSSCAAIFNQNTSTSKNYTCAVAMWYFDAIGYWNVSFFVNDLGGEIGINDTTSFYYNLLQSFVIDSEAIVFNLISGAANQTPISGAIIINNTGNYEVPLGGLGVFGINLYGEQDSSQFMDVRNFSVSVTSGAATPECTATLLQNGSDVSITGSVLPRGNLSLGGGTAQEELYLCVPEVPSALPAQQYSSSLAGSWTIRILVVAVTLSERKIRKRNKLKNDRLARALLLLKEEQGENYSSTNDEIIRRIIRELVQKYHISKKELITVLGLLEEVHIPVTIFVKELGGLEALCKYLKENLGKSYHEIAETLSRNDRTIWSAYHKAKEKKALPLLIDKDAPSMPVRIFSNRTKTILESIIVYLRERGVRNIEIARLLHRDQRNVQAMYSNAVKKRSKISSA